MNHAEPYRIKAVEPLPRTTPEQRLAAMDAAGWNECQPVYQDFEGWTESTRGAKRFSDLPRNAQRYLEGVQDLVRCPIALVSTGPDRTENIVLQDPFSEF